MDFFDRGCLSGFCQFLECNPNIICVNKCAFVCCFFLQFCPEKSHIFSIRTAVILVVSMFFSGNRLHSIPVEISRLRCLRSIDVSSNKLSALPKELCEIQTLESVIVDVAQMRYPTSGFHFQIMFLAPHSHPIYSHVSPAFLTWHPDDSCGLLHHIVWTFRPFVCL